MIRTNIYTLIVLLVIAAMSAAASTGNATPTVPGTPSVCPVTLPNGNDPPTGENVAGRGDGGYGNEFLWTNLWMWGENGVGLPGYDQHIAPTGEFRELKWAWYRYVPGELTIDGHRLDADAPPLEAWIPEGYGSSGFQVSGLTFPTAGCWEVTGHVGTGSLTFVVQVRVLSSGTPVATPD